MTCVIKKADDAILFFCYNLCIWIVQVWLFIIEKYEYEFSTV